MGDAVAVELAREELRRAGTNPHAAAHLAWLLMGIAVFVALVALSWILVPGPAPMARPEEALWMLAGAASAFGLSWALGRLWSGALLRHRARHVALSPNLEPGLWAPDSWTQAGGLLGVLLVMGAFLWMGTRPRTTAPDVLAATALAWTAVVSIPIAGAAMARGFAEHRRRGGSRFVAMPNVPHWLPGQDLAGVLEVQSWFGGTRAVRFELVETTHEHTDGPFEWARWKWRVHVAASVTVWAEAFETPPGLIVVPMTIAIPADALPQGETTKGAWFAWQRFRAHSRSWSLRAKAVEGSPAYEAEFTIAIVAPDTIAAA